MSYLKQVDREHYSFEKYFHLSRWMSYWYQTKEISSKEDVKSILDIGPGTDFLKSVLKISRPDIEYKTLDVSEDVHPDFIGSVTNIPLADNSYDATCAFQVLEHIEFHDFEKALQELSRVARRDVFISLPHFGTSIEFCIKIPFFPRLQVAIKVPWPIKHEFNGQHYWEIGKKGYSPRRVRKIIQKYFIIKNEYIPFEYQYHRFYILKIKE